MNITVVNGICVWEVWLLSAYIYLFYLYTYSCYCSLYSIVCWCVWFPPTHFKLITFVSNENVIVALKVTILFLFLNNTKLGPCNGELIYSNQTVIEHYLLLIWSFYFVFLFRLYIFLLINTRSFTFVNIDCRLLFVSEYCWYCLVF